MLALLHEAIAEQFGISTANQESQASQFLYLDDVSFSGNQIKNDLLQWAEKRDIRNARVYVIAMALYTGGEHYAKTALRQPFGERRIEYSFHGIRFENRLARKRDSQVFWPTHLPADEYARCLPC